MAEKVTLMGVANKPVPRLHLPSYGFSNEAAHGIAWVGVATVFPALIGVAASFDVEAVHMMGRAIGMEGRAKHNEHVSPLANYTPHGDANYGLDFYAPNLNMARPEQKPRNSY